MFSWGLGAVCFGLSVSVVGLFEYNAKRQNLLQVRQQELNQGFLGPNTQQITGQVLEELAAASRTQAPIRRILRLYGYTLPPVTGAPQIAADRNEKADQASESGTLPEADAEAMSTDEEDAP